MKTIQEMKERLEKLEEQKEAADTLISELERDYDTTHLTSAASELQSTADSLDTSGLPDLDNGPISALQDHAIEAEALADGMDDMVEEAKREVQSHLEKIESEMESLEEKVDEAEDLEAELNEKA